MSGTMTGGLVEVYARRRWPLVPLNWWTGDGCSCRQADCPSPAKHPLTRHGLKDATTDLATIGRWKRQWPEANVGLITGVAFDALDVDGEAGDEALGRAARAAGASQSALLTDGPMAETGKGWHLLFASTGEGNRARIVDQVDWRGQGGYIVAPPSVHASGRRYQWLPGLGPETPLQPAPPWLLGLVVRRRPAAPAGSPASQTGNRWARRALEAEVGRVALAPVGSRNDALNRSAFSLGQLVAGGELDAEEVVAALLTAAQQVGLGVVEAERTLASGLRRGADYPRQRSA